MPGVLERPLGGENEGGRMAGNEVRFIFRGQVVRYKGGNREKGQEAAPTIQVCDGDHSD